MANSTFSNLSVQLLPRKFFQTATIEYFLRQGVVSLQVRLCGLRSIKMSFKCWNKNARLKHLTTKLLDATPRDDRVGRDRPTEKAAHVRRLYFQRLFS